MTTVLPNPKPHCYSRNFPKVPDSEWGAGYFRNSNRGSVQHSMTSMMPLNCLLLLDMNGLPGWALWCQPDAFSGLPSRLGRVCAHRFQRQARQRLQRPCGGFQMVSGEVTGSVNKALQQPAMHAAGLVATLDSWLSAPCCLCRRHARCRALPPLLCYPPADLWAWRGVCGGCARAARLLPSAAVAVGPAYAGLARARQALHPGVVPPALTIFSSIRLWLAPWWLCCHLIVAYPRPSACTCHMCNACDCQMPDAPCPHCDSPLTRIQASLSQETLDKTHYSVDMFLAVVLTCLVWRWREPVYPAVETWQPRPAGAAADPVPRRLVALVVVTLVIVFVGVAGT